jgi:large subunit ribosomal protein L25
MQTLHVKERSAGKAKHLRREGMIPGVVYGPSIPSTSIAIENSDLKDLFAQITRSSRISLAIDGDDARTFDVFLKVVDYDAITDEPLHVDFYHPDVKAPLKLDIPVRVIGECKGIKTGGVLNVLFNTISVYGLAKHMPSLITLDVSDLDLGETIHVRDIDFGEVEPLLPPERTIVTVIAPRGMLLEEEETVEGEEGTEGEETGLGEMTGAEGESEAPPVEE